MKAKKENKVYDIADIQKEAYLKEGYDIYDDNGKVIEYSPKKTITYNEYLKEINSLKKKIKESKDDSQKTALAKQVEELTKSNEQLTKELKKATKK